MTDLSQSEFGRAARGAPITPGDPPDIEYFLLGMRSSAGAALRRVHTESPDLARSRFATKMSGFLLQGGAVAAFARALRACLDQYIQWDGEAAPAVMLPTKGKPIEFSGGHIVRARPDVVLERETGTYEARALLWDDLALDRRAAELIALPIVEYVEEEYGQGSTAVARVWQLETGEQQSVAPEEAEARRGDVEGLLASL